MNDWKDNIQAIGDIENATYKPGNKPIRRVTLYASNASFSTRGGKTVIHCDIDADPDGLFKAGESAK